MGRKVHPLGFRLGVIRDWQARWYADKPYAEFLQEDFKLRKAIKSAYAEAAISQIQVERQANEVFITIHTSRPGIVIGRGGQRVDETRTRLEQLIGKRVRLNIQEVAQPELDAYLVSRTVADQIEHRIAYRRAMKQAIFRTTQAGARGMKITCSGRLGGAEIARCESLHEGRVPLHTLRADIDYGFTEANTTLGRIGIKVWIYKGDILPEPKEIEAEEIPAEEIGEGIEEEFPTLAEAVQAPEEAVGVAPMEVSPAAVTEVSAEPVAVESMETPPATEAQLPAEPVAAKSAEKPPAAEKKPAKPRQRRTKAAASTEVEEVTAKATKDKVTKGEATKGEVTKGKATKGKATRAKATKSKTATTKEEEKNVTTQAGEVPQES